jgi:hypothetical protein
MRYFIVPSVLAVLALIAIFATSGLQALFIAILLMILEVTLSFDNAVVNARVLKHMSEKWRQRFLTWGIAIAVFGTRFIFPILIVAVSVAMSPWAVATLALFEPEAYGHLLEGARYAIYSFGAAFLLMVSLKYFFDEAKEVHWIHVIERHLVKLGRIEALEIGIALLVLFLLSFLVPQKEAALVLASGIVGIVLFIAMEGLTSSFSRKVTQGIAAASGLSLFLYLEVLDAAFSLDSVVGAFALTSSIPIIVAGLGIGAYFVRSFTMYFVEKDTLSTLLYLEHGAHWAIFGLSASMFAGLVYHVPEPITGVIGLAFVLAAYYSSVRMRGQTIEV